MGHVFAQRGLQFFVGHPVKFPWVTLFRSFDALTGQDALFTDGRDSCGKLPISHGGDPDFFRFFQ